MKLLCLISGGIDSVVAAHLMLEKGHSVEFVHFDNQPFTDGSPVRKSRELVEKLATSLKKKFQFHVVSHGANIVEFGKNCEHRPMCMLCRRSMLRIAEKLAKKSKAEALLTGENLGQVASQTLDNLCVTNAAAGIPIVRPLIGFNKQGIISVARVIGTYDISVQPGHCCTAVPLKPATRAVLAEVEAEEKKLDINALTEQAFKSLASEVIDGTNKDRKKKK